MSNTSPSSKAVLIAGGAGFIGSHLCERFLNDNWSVVCLDSLKTGSLKNIAKFKSNPGFSFVQHDIIEPWTSEKKFDLILNFACAASPVHYQADPLHTVKTSFTGTMNLLEIARKQKTQLLQASTSEVYGDPIQHPQPETYWGNVNTVGPRSCYDEGKRVSETLCYDYNKLFGVDVRVIRIFNTYGPQMAIDDGRVVCNFIAQALRGEPLTVFGNGEQTRSFCYVSDLVEGIVKYSRLPNPWFGPVNLGNDGEFTMLELAKEVLALTGSKSAIEYRPLPPDDPKTRRPDLTLARSKLNWSPTIPLREGLTKAIPYFRTVLNSL